MHMVLGAAKSKYNGIVCMRFINCFFTINTWYAAPGAILCEWMLLLLPASAVLGCALPLQVTAFVPAKVCG
jgi:hypothetical protein